MYRECMNALALKVASKSESKMYLVGAASSGKSIAMAIVVAKMRASGWLVSLNLLNILTSPFAFACYRPECDKLRSSIILDYGCAISCSQGKAGVKIKTALYVGHVHSRGKTAHVRRLLQQAS